MSHNSKYLCLATEDLAFFRLACDLFPNPESPLRFLEEQDVEPQNAEATFLSLKERGLLKSQGFGASDFVHDRLLPVSECNARVTLAIKGDNGVTRNFFLNTDGGVEYQRENNNHYFGPRRAETALALELAQHFGTTCVGNTLNARLAPGDYLVFAVFARDVRQTLENLPGAEAPMSVDEVLAYFDEPEEDSSKILNLNDDPWRKSLDNLRAQSILKKVGTGFELESNWHSLAKEILADRQHIITRFDFLGDQWLVREMCIYPTEDSIFRLGTEPDGTVSIEELSATSLGNALAGVISTLPNLLNPEAPPILKYPFMPGGSR